MSMVVPSPPTENLPGVVRGLELNVTGEDAGHNLFRDKVAVLKLQGRECTFESKRRVQPGTSLMVEIFSVRDSEQSWRAAAIVETVSAVSTNEDLFHVAVVLGRTYEPGTSVEHSTAPRSSAANLLGGRPAPNLVSAPIVPAPAVSALVGAALPHTAAFVPASVTRSEPPNASVQAPQTEIPNASLAPPSPVSPASPVSDDQIRDLKLAVASQMREALQDSFAANRASSRTLTPEQADGHVPTETKSSEAERIFAMLRPLIAEMVRETANSESERQTRALRRMLSEDVEKAVHEPLAIMAKYAQTLPAIDEQTVRHLLGQVAEKHLERATQAIQPMIQEMLRAAIAAEYEQQTARLKNDVFTEVGKALQGPARLQMAAMIESALTARMGQYPARDNPPAPAIRNSQEVETVQELMIRLQERLESIGENIGRGLAPPAPAESDPAGATGRTTPVTWPVETAKVRDF